MGKQAYTEDEWRIVAGGPYYAAAFVVSSAPHHAIGTIRDMLASASLIKDAEKLAPGNQLVADVAAATGGGIGDPGSTKHNPENIERLRAVLVQAQELVSRSDPQDAPGYRSMILEVARTAAETSKNGVFASRGESVNDDERAALDTLSEIFSPTAN